MSLLTSCQRSFENVFDGFSVDVGCLSVSIPCRINGVPSEGMDVAIPFWGYCGAQMRPCTVSVSGLPQGMSVLSNKAASASAGGQLVLRVSADVDLGAGAYSGAVSLTFTVGEKKVVKKFLWTKVYDAKEFDAIREEIENAATNISSGTKTYSENLVNGLRDTIASLYVSRVEGDEETVAQLKSYITSRLDQTSEDYELKFSQRDEIIANLNGVLAEYMRDMETYIRFSAEGIEIGKKENSDELPYSVLLSNEKLSFRSYGVEVAYVQYNKLFITSAEVLDKISVGSVANGGYFDFITTSTGMGLKWRDV